MNTDKRKEYLALLLKTKVNIHFLGVGGVGMSSLARYFLERGYSVSGSDLKMSPITSRLAYAGCRILKTREELPSAPALVVYSSAIKEDNAQFCILKKNNVPAFHRSELLGYCLRDKESIGITGTHGKTTTTALLSFVLQELGVEPTCFVGGDILNYEDNTLIGNDRIMVAEVDESDKSLLNIHTRHSIITNLEEEHMDTYASLEDIKGTMSSFLAKQGSDGVVIYNNDDDNVREVVSRSGQKAVSFGMREMSCFSAADVHSEEDGMHFSLWTDGCFKDHVKIPLFGMHNVYNMLAVYAAGLTLGLDLKKVAEVIPHFMGASRRMQVIYKDAAFRVIDDYAHHPTEIKATLQALNEQRGNDQRLIVVFQPHRYTRTLHLGESFGDSFIGADLVVVTSIYGAGEKAIEGVNEQTIVSAVQSAGVSAIRANSEDIVSIIAQERSAKTVVAFLGAGDISEYAHKFVSTLKHASLTE